MGSQSQGSLDKVEREKGRLAICHGARSESCLFLSFLIAGRETHMAYLVNQCLNARYSIWCIPTVLHYTFLYCLTQELQVVSSRVVGRIPPSR